MSVLRVSRPEPSGTLPARPPRVREQARDALALMAFSAGLSGGLALLLLASSGLGR